MFLIITLLLFQLVYGLPLKKHVNPGIIPQYVIDHSPVIYLYAEERYLPYSIEKFVTKLYTQDVDGNNITGQLTIQDLESLGARSNASFDDIYMTALSDFDKDPEWITGARNIPDIATGLLKDAPATLIVVDKGNGWVDAFWFYFYSFNLGPFVMGTGPYGNHVGDWEHSLVRFYKGEPQVVWMSAHGGGTAYKFNAMEMHKSANTKRPVLFSARGTHANYATVGQHSHDIPFYMLSDFTDRGSLWDPALNYLAYTYDGSKITFANGTEPGREERYGNWLSYLGHWGDKKLVPSDPRQKYSPFEWKYIDGPLGPLTKNLMRIGVCQRSKWWNFMGACQIRRTLKMGEGIEAEGGGCALAFDNIKPHFLSVVLRFLTWRGWGCTAIDRLFG
jgi:hypothetical protein